MVVAKGYREDEVLVGGGECTYTCACVVLYNDFLLFAFFVVVEGAATLDENLSLKISDFLSLISSFLLLVAPSPSCFHKHRRFDFQIQMTQLSTDEAPLFSRPYPFLESFTISYFWSQR